jgi:hypothetical protein
VAVLQAADGTYYVTGAAFSDGGLNVLPAVGRALHTADGHAIDETYTKSLPQLKALVWADQWLDYSNTPVGEVASLTSTPSR